MNKLTLLFAEGFGSIFTTKTPSLEIVEDDPDDNKFIECAVALAPLRGQQRNDLMKDLRIYPLNRKTVVAFVVDEDQQAVRILNIFYGGRDYEAIVIK
jgi:hypothetical protein